MPQPKHHHPPDPSGNIKPAANIGFCEEPCAGQPEGWAAEVQGYDDQAGLFRVWLPTRCHVTPVPSRNTEGISSERKATLPMETIFPDRVSPTHSQYCPEEWTPAVPTLSSQQTWRHRLAATSQSVHQLSPLPGTVVLSPFSDYYLLSPPLCSALSPDPYGLGLLICHMGEKRPAGHVGEASFGTKEKNKGGELLPSHLTPPRGKQAAIGRLCLLRNATGSLLSLSPRLPSVPPFT